MNTYIDCGSGVAGDMLIGALVGLGLSPRELNQTLRRVIPLSRWKVVVRPVERQMWPALSVVVEGDRTFGSASRMKTAVSRARLPAAVKESARAVFTLLERAERHAHDTTHPHFEDQGLALLDTLVDVVGTVWGFWRMGLENVTASPVQVGRVAPASSWMIQERKIPVYNEPTRFEMATPTGVALLSVLAENFGWMREMNLEKAGYGAGQKDIPGRPNVLALYQGKPTGQTAGGPSQDDVVLLETVIDDMDPRLYPHVSDLLFSAGALDVWWSPVGMKKGRPGIAFSVLCKAEREMALVGILFAETTTLGLRRQPMKRWILPRAHRGLFKIAQLPGRRAKTQVEYELARAIAARRYIPLKKVLKYRA